MAHRLSYPHPIRPTRSEIDGLQVGDLAPDPFGDLAEVTEIFYRVTNPAGLHCIGYYVRFGEGSGSSVSNGLTEGEVVATLPVCSWWHQMRLVPASECVTLAEAVVSARQQS